VRAREVGAQLRTSLDVISSWVRVISNLLNMSRCKLVSESARPRMEDELAVPLPSEGTALHTHSASWLLADPEPLGRSRLPPEASCFLQALPPDVSVGYRTECWTGHYPATGAAVHMV